jgi:hypothetical protein
MGITGKIAETIHGFSGISLFSSTGIALMLGNRLTIISNRIYSIHIIGP